MSYLRSFFGGGGEEQETDNGAEIVERLVERVETCTALEDRRDALKALRNMAKTMRLAVGTMGMNVFMEILTKERNATDLLALTLEVLVAVLSGEDDTPDDDELGERLAEVILKKDQFMAALLATLEIYEFAVRRVAIQLLTSLLRHRGSEVQNAVIGQPMGITKLVDLIHDNREVVRNEAVLMLCELSRAHSQVQQLLAYDNAFNLLLDIIELEPIDSIVIEDCLFVILNLLRKNANNQELFRENNLIVRLAGCLRAFLFPEDEEGPIVDEGEWAKQRTANLIFLLQIIRALVSPDNSHANSRAAQKVMHHTKILGELCRVLLSELGVSVEVLTETVIAVAEVIRGYYTNQEYFASTFLVTADNAKRPALLVLLLSMTAEKQPFKLRCAVFYCFLCYLHDNEFGKAKIIETLLPSSKPEEAMSTGAMVVQALSASESIQSWFGCVALLHCVLDVEHLRDQLLRVQLSLTIDEEPVSLLIHVSKMLVSLGNRRIQQRSGLLMLLIVWLHRCPRAVSEFVTEDNLNYLTTQIVDECGEGTESEQQVLRGLMAALLLTCLSQAEDEKTRSSLDALVTRRVGRDFMCDAIEGLSRTEQFVRAAQKPQPLAKTGSELCLDYHFIKLFKANESNLLRLIRSSDEISSGSTNNEAIIQSFKDLIKRQDEEISVLRTEHKRTKEEIENLKTLNDKAEVERELEETRLRLEQSSLEVEKVNQLNAQVLHLQNVNQQWVAEVEKYKQWAAQWQNFQIGQLPNAGDVVVQQLQAQQAQLEQQLQFGWEAYEKQCAEIKQHMEAATAYRQRAEYFEKMANDLQAAKQPLTNGNVQDAKTEDELRRLKEEQEDLLVLLADQHNKIGQYKTSLRTLGQEVSDDEDED